MPMKKLGSLLWMTAYWVVVAATFVSPSAAQTAVGSRLDCNGWSPISPNVSRTWPCADPRGGIPASYRP